ncbi:MAG: hypothetical protein ACOZQL_18060 [Myxococcota bacterium]
MRSPLVIFAILLAACAPPALVDQDVSFLVPLPEARSFLPASGILPRSLFDRFQHPLTVVDEPDALYAALSTVAVRLDACFREGVDPSVACRPQVRLVLQPVFDSADGATTRDAAVHLFFSASEAEVVAAVRELSQLRVRLGVAMPGGLAGPHPGFDEPRWVEGVKKVLLPLLTPQRIVRATEMSVHASNQAWIFSGLEVAGETRTDIVIPTLGSELDGHVTSTGERAKLAITLGPSPVAEPALVTILASDLRDTASPADLAAAVAALGRIEDPAGHNPGTIDCGSCHVVATAKKFLLRDGLEASADSSTAPSDAYADSRALRAFGYFFTAPAISPRVQRETALVRADLSRRLEN